MSCYEWDPACEYSREHRHLVPSGQAYLKSQEGTEYLAELSWTVDLRKPGEIPFLQSAVDTAPYALQSHIPFCEST